MSGMRNRTFDMVKVLATIFILFHHYQMAALMITDQTFPEVTFYDSGFRSGDFSWGYMVELFFLISGFFTVSYIRKIQQGLTFYRFYTHRMARILPVAAVSSVVCAAVLILYDKAYQQSFWGTDPSVFGVVIQSLGIQDGWGFQSPGLNGVTWYCSVLLLCCLLFYAVVYWSRRLGISPCYGFAILIFAGCAGQTYNADLPFLDSSTTRGYAAFFAGIFFAMALPRLRAWRGTVPLSVAFLVVVALAYYKHDGNLQYMPFLLTFLVYPAILLVLDAGPCRWISQLPLWEHWVRITYGVFLWHLPCYILLYTLLKLAGMDPLVLVNWKMMLLCAAGMQLVGWLSYRWLEKPLNRKAAAIFASLDPDGQPVSL